MLKHIIQLLLSKKKWPEEIILLSHVFVTNAVPRRGNMTTTFMIFCGINFFSRVLRDSTTRFVGPSVGPLVRHTLLFLGFCGLWPHCTCPNDLVTSNTALPTRTRLG